MSVTKQVCPKCNGTRHVPTKSGWKRCVCVARQVREIAYVDANIPAALRKVAAVRMIGDVPGIDMPPGHPHIWWVRGSAVSTRRLSACYYPVKLAADLGIPALATRLSDLIDDRFVEGRPLHIAAKAAVALYVDLDGVDHKFAGPEVLGLYQDRSLANVVTVFGSSGDVGQQTGRYGVEVSRIFAKAKAISRFKV